MNYKPSTAGKVTSVFTRIVTVVLLMAVAITIAAAIINVIQCNLFTNP